MASKNSSRKSIHAAALLSLGALILVFGCDKHSSPVSPRGQGSKGQVNLSFHFPKGMSAGGPVRAMVSGSDFGQVEATAAAVPTYVATGFPYYTYSTSQLSLDVPIGTGRHIMVGYFDSYYNNQYAYGTVDVVAGVNVVNLAPSTLYGGYVDNYYYGSWYDLDTETSSMTYVPGASDIHFIDVYDGNAYHWDIEDAAGAGLSASRLRFIGNKTEIPLYGMPFAPASASSYKGLLWNYPTNDGAKGGATGYVEYNDIYLIKTTAGKLYWITPTSVYAVGSLSDSVGFEFVADCTGIGLPTSLVPCP